jgi:hypothetical protein
MPDVVQSREGYATLEYKLVLGQTRTIEFDPNRVSFVDAEIKDSVYESATGLHSFRTGDPQFLDSVKQAMSTANPLLEFRLGFGTPKDTYWLPWQRHIIKNYYARYEGIATAAGHLLVFVTADVLIRLERANKVVARKGTVADIVKAIAGENGLESVVEDTDGKFILYQSFIDDTRFIRNRLLPRAINRKGRGGYYFFILDNVLHFHTPDYQSNARQMNYYDVFGTELAMNDLSQDPNLWDSGVAGIRVVAHDPFTGQTQEVDSDPEKAMRLADSIYQFQSVPNGAWNTPYHLSANPPIEADAIAQFGYQRSRQQVFKTNVTVDKTISIRHGDLLNLSIAQQNSVASSHSGYYYVTSTAHIVKKQAVSTVYTLERGEVRGQDQSLSAQNVQKQLVPEAKAPGEFPNILEVQSSEATKGAGKQSSAKTYAVVADANTGSPA